MENLYEKYDGMLMTFPDDITEEEIAQYQNSGRKPESKKYDRVMFEKFVKEAEPFVCIETKDVEGDLTSGYGGPQLLTPENMVIYKNELYAIRYHQICAVGYADYLVPLHKLLSRPYLVDTHTDRFDDYGDHDTWEVKTYIEIKKK